MATPINWTEEIKNFMRANSKNIGRLEMAEEISRRFRVDVTFTMVKNAYKRFGIAGKDTRFKSGDIPANKGLKGKSHPGSIKTQFKIGDRPKNWLPVGSERINGDGFHQVKMTDTGYPPRDWVMKSKVIWERVHGKIPANHFLRFVDGNRDNCVIENLILVSRQEHVVMNRWLRTNEIPEGGTKALHLMAQIKIAASRRAKNKTAHTESGHG